MAGPEMRVKAAAWSPDGSLRLLADVFNQEKKKRACLTLRDGQVGDERPALARANRLVGLESGTLLVMTANGASQAIRPTGKKSASVPRFSMTDLVVCGGVAYACGWQRRLVRYDEATGAWSDTNRTGIALSSRSRDSLAPYASKIVTGPAFGGGFQMAHHFARRGRSGSKIPHNRRLAADTRAGAGVPGTPMTGCAHVDSAQGSTALGQSR